MRHMLHLSEFACFCFELLACLDRLGLGWLGTITPTKGMLADRLKKWRSMVVLVATYEPLSSHVSRPPSAHLLCSALRRARTFTQTHRHTHAHTQTTHTRASRVVFMLRSKRRLRDQPEQQHQHHSQKAYRSPRSLHLCLSVSSR